MTKVTHLINGLGNGGAEKMLYNIIKFHEDPAIEHKVISMGTDHYYDKKIRDLGIEVVVLDIRRRPFQTFVRLVKEINNSNVLSSWMYHSNLIAYLASKFTHVNKIVWSIRHSNLSKNYNKKTTLFVNAICSKMHAGVSAILFNGEKSKEVHCQMGYPIDKSFVVENGCDCEHFSPKKDAKNKLLDELNLPRNKRVVLSVTKDHPIKDVPTFIRAFSNVDDDNAVAVLCGRGIDENNQQLVSLCQHCSLQINENIFLLGLREDIPDLLSAADVYVLHSAGEAFPNSLLEAMACGCICITSEVGDAAKLLECPELVFDVGDDRTLSKLICETLTLPQNRKEAMKLRNRKRVLEKYDIRNIVQVYERIYKG